MRNATSGTTLPTATVTFPIASQALATNSAYAPAHVACRGARTTMGPCLISARSAMPRTAGGADPVVIAFCDADDFVTWRVSNNNANALVALAADVTLDIIQFPVAP
jgi:hypothetical protein